MSKEVTEIINTLCEKLGVAASVLVPEMARYNIARLAFLTVVQTILAVVMAVVVVKIVKWSLGNEDADWDDKALSSHMHHPRTCNGIFDWLCNLKRNRPHRMDCITDSISS